MTGPAEDYLTGALAELDGVDPALAAQIRARLNGNGTEMELHLRLRIDDLPRSARGEVPGTLGGAARVTLKAALLAAEYRRRGGL